VVALSIAFESGSDIRKSNFDRGQVLMHNLVFFFISRVTEEYRQDKREVRTSVLLFSHSCALGGCDRKNFLKMGSLLKRTDSDKN